MNCLCHVAFFFDLSAPKRRLSRGWYRAEIHMR
jgi:hypothetical protein